LEDAIVLRYHDLTHEPSDSSNLPQSNELQAIRRVAQQLRQLKIEKLGWSQPATALAAAMPAAMPISSTLASAPPIVDGVKEPIPTRPARRSLASRLESALLATQRAWQNWVFKSLK